MTRIAISKKGRDVTKAESKDMVIDSNMSTVKVISDGYFDYTSDTTKSVKHKLSYMPAFLVYKLNTSKTYWRMALGRDAWTDPTKLNVTALNGERVKYYILYNPAMSTGGDGFTESSPKLQISKEGVDLNKASASDMVFNLDWNTFSIYDSIDLDVDTSGFGYYTKSVKHDLGYAPAFIATVRRGDTPGAELFMNPHEFANFTDYIQMYVEVNDKEILATVYKSFTDDYTYHFRVHLFTESLEEL